MHKVNKCLYVIKFYDFIAEDNLLLSLKHSVSTTTSFDLFKINALNVLIENKRLISGPWLDNIH